MNSKIKIAIYSGEVPSTVFIERLIEGLSHEGYAVVLFGYLKRSTKYANPNISVNTYSDNRIQKLYHLLKYSFLLGLFRKDEKKRLDAIINKKGKYKTLLKIKYYPVLWHKPTVFHLQWAKSIDDWIWVQDFGIKLVVSLRGVHINYTPITHPEVSEIYKRLFPKVDGFHAVSETIAKEAMKYGAQENKIQVVYSGLDQINIPLKENENEIFTVLSVGRTHWVKGYTYALEACKILKDLGFKFRYEIIGAKGNEELLYLVNDFGLQNQVVLLGFMPFTNIQFAMQNADVVLLPSVEEGIANVVLEAMQLGTVVVSTDCGGMDEVIQDGVNGFIAPTRNPQTMADAILKVFRLSADEKNKMGREARITIEKQHTSEKMIHDMISLYQKILAS